MTIDHTYPAMRHMGTHPPWSDEYRNAEKMLAVYESVFDDLAELAFGDPLADDLLRDQATRLSAITQACGSIGSWTLSQYGRLHAEANRLLPQGHEFRGPNWSEP